ncbi:MAG: pentapeptide repeat-containing protein [Cyanobacteria bacterium J06621_8]
MAVKLLEFWQENRPELDSLLEAGEFTANTTAAGLGLALALGVVNPAMAIPAAGLAFAGSTRKVIEWGAKKSNKKLTLEDIASLITPVAYWESFNYWLNRNQVLATKLSENNQAISIDSQIENLTLDHQLAINALSNFPTSELAQTFNQILSSQLNQQGLDQIEAEIIASWVAWNAVNFFDKTLDEFRDADNLQIINIYRNTVPHEDDQQHASIDKYLKTQIATKPKEKVFNEEFSFKDLYVPLKAVPVDANGRVSPNKASYMLVEDWAKGILQNPNKAKQVMFIQGGPGRGKSVFCRMFADYVRQKLHPLWIPVLIRLRDIESFEASFAKTLQGAVKADFAQDEGWLTDSKLRFLFLLDGFDELRMEGRTKGGIERLIKQVGSFQERCDTSEMGHRFIITGRQLALQGISYLPENLERVELLEMDDDLRGQWFEKWEKVVDKDQVIANRKLELLKGFLQSRTLTDEVKEELAREPLLLYLLAAMHRDGKISVADLSGTSGIQTKIKIYEQALNWVLTEQRRPIQREIVRLEQDELSQVLMEAGLCVVQSGGECARVKMIRERLKKSEPEISAKIEEIQAKNQDEVLKNALAAFYLKAAAGDAGGSVEFFHKSFGEFLCAKRMQQALEDWVAPGRRGRGFNLNDDQLAEEIYDLWGYGGLTQEIMEYLWGLLAATSFHFEKLFMRLEDFYERWCDGEFIDAEGTTLPQAKMRRLRELKPQFQQATANFGQRQVDVYTGLNVMIMLFELHRHGQQHEELREVLSFHPCGKGDQEGELKDRSRLFKIMGYCCCVNRFTFLDIIGFFLSNADLSNVTLDNANLTNANLFNVNLTNANLFNANLTNANLFNANLSSANLFNTNLINANLTNANLSNAIIYNANLFNANLSNAKLGNAELHNSYLRDAVLIDANLTNAKLTLADLTDANLSNANLKNADLSNANLTNVNFISTNLEGVIWNDSTDWSNAQGLGSAFNIPEALKQKIID